MSITGQSALLHTPGPWQTGGKDGYDGLRVETVATRKHSQSRQIGVVMEIRTTIAYCREPDGVSGIPNARLIAAAPDLLALARKLASECAECHGRAYTFSDDGIVGFGPDDREPTREACAECADIREVIAKAEGHS